MRSILAHFLNTFKKSVSWLFFSILFLSFGCQKELSVEKAAGFSDSDRQVLKVDDFFDPNHKSEAEEDLARDDSSGFENTSEVISEVDSQSTQFKEVDLKPIFGRRIIVNSKLGEINGRPIFADEILGVVRDLLRVQTESFVGSFDEESKMPIRQEIKRLVDERLIFSEAKIDLTEQQSMGVVSFLNKLREDIIGQSGGSQTIASERVDEEEGMTLDQLIKEKEKQLLIDEVLRREIFSAIVISWRDIEQYYATQKNSLGDELVRKVVLKRIRVPIDDQEARNQIENSLSEGKLFEVIAKNMGDASGGSWEVLPIPSGEEFGLIEGLAPVYLEQLRGADVGDILGPIEVGKRVAWIQVASVIEPKVFDLYDPFLQTRLKQMVTNLERNKAYQKFLSRLYQRGIVEDVEKMERRALRVARSQLVR